jgi:hypothetical protein
MRDWAVGRPQAVQCEGSPDAGEGCSELLRRVFGVRRAREREALLEQGELGGEVVV